MRNPAGTPLSGMKRQIKESLKKAPTLSTKPELVTIGTLGEYMIDEQGQRAAE